MWTTSGTQADWICLLANTSEGSPHKSMMLICLPMKTKGVSIAKKFARSAWWIPTRRRFFRRCARTATSSYRRGWHRFHLSDAALPRGTAAGGVLDFQVVHFRLAELKTEVEALRALTYRTVDLYVSGQDVTELASMAKLKAGRLLREVPDACLQYWGGMGYT